MSGLWKQTAFKLIRKTAGTLVLQKRIPASASEFHHPHISLAYSWYPCFYSEKEKSTITHNSYYSKHNTSGLKGKKMFHACFTDTKML